MDRGIIRLGQRKAIVLDIAEFEPQIGGPNDATPTPPWDFAHLMMMGATLLTFTAILMTNDRSRGHQ